jgi:ribosomal protein S18 acetylase RimI-like enzyme
MLEFTSRRKLKPFIRPVFNLINLTFGDIYGFIAFTEQEMNDFANRYLFLIDPRYVKVIVTEQDEVIAFVIAMDDISRGIRRSHGYLFPIGFIHLLLAAKKSHQLNLLLGAIDPHFQGQGLDVLLGMSLIKSAKESGKTTIDSHLELEYNTKVRAEMEKMGGVVYKRFRIYQKEL